MEFSSRKHVAEVWWTAVCDSKLVDGDLVVVVICKLVEWALANGLHDLLSSYSLNDLRVWVIGVVLQMKKDTTGSLDKFFVLHRFKLLGSVVEVLLGILIGFCKQR